MTITTFDAKIDATVPELVGLTARQYPKNFNTFTFGAVKSTLSPNLAGAWNALHFLLTGKTADNDAVLVSIKADNNSFDTLYSPQLGLQDNQLALMFGDVKVPISISNKKENRGQLENIKVPEHLEVTTSIENTEINGFDTACLVITVANDNTNLITTYPFTLKFGEETLKSYKANKDNVHSKEQLQGLLSRDLAYFKKLLGELPSFSNLATYKLSDLVLNQQYHVVNTKGINLGSRVAFLLEIDCNGTTLADDTKPEENFQVWGNSQINAVLAQKPEVSIEKPAKLTVNSCKATKSGNMTCKATFLVDVPTGIKTESALDFSL